MQIAFFNRNNSCINDCLEDCIDSCINDFTIQLYLVCNRIDLLDF